MKKNHDENRPRDGRQNRRPQKGGKPRDERSSRKKRRERGGLEGFSTLNQVAGVPKPHAYHSQIPVNPTRTVAEPKPTCPICGKSIDNISLSFFNEKGESVHFDCVLEEIRKMYPCSENQSISYVGHGNFAKVEKDAEGKYTIVETIPYENPERNAQMKEYVDSLKK